MFSHELAHLLSKNIISYKKSNNIRPEEMNSVFCSLIDFTTNEYKPVDNIKNIINNQFTEEQLNYIEKNGLNSLSNAKNDRRSAVFLLFLHEKKMYNKIVKFLEAKSIENFIDNNWNSKTDKLFISWIIENTN
jgi:hypothetical protein